MYKGERRPGPVGIWDRRWAVDARDKIAAIGVRVRHWVSYHGIAINLEARPRAFRWHRALRHRGDGRRRPMA